MLSCLAGCPAPSASSCRFNSDCPVGRHCAAATCTSDCTSHAECVPSHGAGAVCTSFGECVALPDAGAAMDAWSPPPADGGSDAAGADAREDADAGADGSVDATADGSTDAGVDVSADGSIDAGSIDAGSVDDAGVDPRFDAGSDAARDSGVDASVPLPYSSVSIGNTTNLVVPLSTTVVVPYATELHDDLGEFDPATSTFTASHSGTYRVCASILAPAGTVAMDVFVDGSRRRALGRGPIVGRGCAVVRLAAGSRLDVRLQWDRAGTISPNSLWNWLTIDEEMRTGTLLDVGNVTEFTLASSTFGQVRYTTATHDSGGSWNAAMHRFTAGHSGDFEFCASAIADDPGVAFETDLYVDGARVRALAAGIGTASGCHILRLTTSQYVEVWAYQASGSAQHFSPSSHASWLTVAELPTGGTAVSIGDIAPFVAPNLAFRRVPYNSEIYDDGAEFNPVMSQWTAPRAGDYEICAGLYGAPNFELDLFVGGARERGFAYGPPLVGTGCRVLRAVAGQVVEVQTHQSTGADVSVGSNFLWSWLQVHALR